MYLRSCTLSLPPALHDMQAEAHTPPAIPEWEQADLGHVPAAGQLRVPGSTADLRGICACVPLGFLIDMSVSVCIYVHLSI